VNFLKKIKEIWHGTAGKSGFRAGLVRLWIVVEK